MIKKMIDRIRFYKYQKAISADTVEEIFTNIYSKKIWFGNRESASGAGSTLNATEGIRELLPKVLSRYQCQTLLDIGCGDFNWMKEVILPCSYIGVDIVGSLIERNARLFGNEQIRFQKLNAVEERLPANCDVIICREVLFHLSFEDGLKLIGNVLKSDGKYLIITTNDHVTENRDIRTGEFRNLNLMLPPYNFPRYQGQISDDRVSQNRILAIWDIDSLKA